jgi:hypothetical protein
MKASTPISPKLTLALQDALFWQALLFVLSALMLDFFYVNHLVLAAAAAHWLVMVVVLIRRGDSPTRGDLLFCRVGFFFVFAITVVSAPYLMEARGNQTLSEKWFGHDIVRDGECSGAVALIAFIWVLAYPLWRRFQENRSAKKCELLGQGTREASGMR